MGFEEIGVNMVSRWSSRVAVGWMSGTRGRDNVTETKVGKRADSVPERKLEVFVNVQR